MKVTLVLVTSVNGKLTEGDNTNIYKWTSKEDQQYFFSLIEKSRAIIMGRKTYEAAKHKIKLVPGKLRIILTKNPIKYTNITGQLEFSSEQPKKIIDRLRKENYREVLIVGGNSVAASFLNAKLIDTISLTLEPYLFGRGIHFLDKEISAVKLILFRVKKLNNRGTLLLQYKINRLELKSFF
ncbi:dihydrofolate reductase [Candidatus Gottesmanbacteria bacterium]|nr:dihydrofolate reductase [Candidatus Gottesmanbacteria bacterium]